MDDNPRAAFRNPDSMIFSLQEALGGSLIPNPRSSVLVYLIKSDYEALAHAGAVGPKSVAVPAQSVKINILSAEIPELRVARQFLFPALPYVACAADSFALRRPCRLPR